MNDFRNRLRAAVDKSKYRNSLRTLSIDAGLGERTIANMLANESIDHSKSGPGLFTMATIAELLDISLDWLSGGKDSSRALTAGDIEFALSIERFASSSSGQFTQGNQPPTPQAMQRLFVRSGGRIEAFEKVLKYCDRYNAIAPGAECVSVKDVGTESLAATTMGTPDPAVLQVALSSVADDKLRTKLVYDHLDVQRRGCLSTVERLDIQMPNRPVLVRMDYIRVLLYVTDTDGNSEILSYSSLIA